MSGLRLRLRRPLEDRINLFGIVPDQLRDLSLEAIAALPVANEATEERLSDWFDVFDGDRSILKLEGDLSRADYIGGGMRDGTIELTGGAGHFLAEGMRGGRIIVTGNASDYACSDLRGGSVVIEGSVGRCCAAARPAVRRGMRGGSVTICGDAGEQLCTRMRRGIVVLYGTAEGDVATGMIAGSLVLHSHVEGVIGAGMRRGTILVLSDRMPFRHAGFTAAEIVELSYLPLLVRSLDAKSQALFADQLSAGSPVSRSLGDRAVGGMGELIWFTPIIKDESTYTPAQLIADDHEADVAFGA